MSNKQWQVPLFSYLDMSISKKVIMIYKKADASSALTDIVTENKMMILSAFCKGQTAGAAAVTASKGILKILLQHGIEATNDFMISLLRDRVSTYSIFANRKEEYWNVQHC